MSDIMLNLDFSNAAPRQPTQPKLKHRRFLKRRPYLERKGYLKKKQCKGAEEARPSVPPAGAANKGPRACQPAPPPPPASCAARLACPVVTNRAWAPKGRPLDNGAIQQPATQRRPRPISAFPPSPGPALPTAGRAHALKPERGLLLSECQSALPPLPLSAKGARPSGPAAPPPRGSVRPYKYVALDCEMVGTGPGGKRSELARCSITGYDGDVLYDKYVLPQNPIVDYRTRWSGIRRQHMKTATPFQLAQKEILKILCGKIVIGHAIHNDFKALNYFHPPLMTRDTSRIPLLNQMAGFPEYEAVSLKRLTKALLQRDIQVGTHGHSSVEDACATMELYKLMEAQLGCEIPAPPSQK
ncbi:interferon-stimulated 20 kDa exonuclease-like 2 [Scyliorhinus torazame]|uniref:interferon-stimulated 20 kDa exonuclease-like 2 n=1 Tax=Scyliorhinus torazame TaxID=75743 RepID=UPI003B5B417E